MKHEITIKSNGLKQCSCGSRQFVNGKCGFDKTKIKEATLLDHVFASLNKK